MFKKRKVETPVTQASPDTTKETGVVNTVASKPPGEHVSPTKPTPSTTTFLKDAPPMSRSPFSAPTNPLSNRPAGMGTGSAPSGDKSDRRTLVVGRGISVQGVVQDAERLVVEGTVEASMLQAKELLVAEGGVLRGEVEVEDAELAGEIDGTLTVRGNLTVRKTGRLIGKTRCKRLQVEDGGQISGNLEMILDHAQHAADKPKVNADEREKSSVS